LQDNLSGKDINKKMYEEDLKTVNNDIVSQSSGGTMHHRKGVGKSLLKKL